MENDDFQSALDFTNEALETITDDLTSAVDKEVRDVEDLVRTAAELGGDRTKATTLIERARGDIGNLDFEKAKNAVRQSRAESEKALQRSLDGRAGDFSKFVQEARAVGADPAAGQECFDQAEAAIKKGNYREGAQLAKQGFQALQQAQFQRVVGIIATSREKFTAAANMGIDIQGPMADLTGARDLLKRGAFSAALDSAKRADGAVDTIIQGYRNVERRLRSCTARSPRRRDSGCRRSARGSSRRWPARPTRNVISRTSRRRSTPRPKNCARPSANESCNRSNARRSS